MHRVWKIEKNCQNFGKISLMVVVETKLILDYRLDEKSLKNQWNWQYFKKLPIFRRNYRAWGHTCERRGKSNNHKKIVNIPPIFQQFFFFSNGFFGIFSKIPFKKKLSMFFSLFFSNLSYFKFISHFILYYPFIFNYFH